MKIEHIFNRDTSIISREYFASQAMIGLLANPNNSKELSGDIAEWAVVHANALLAELAKEQSDE